MATNINTIVLKGMGHYDEGVADQAIYPGEAVRLAADGKYDPETLSAQVAEGRGLKIALEDALQGNAETQGQERLHVQMRLAAARIRDAARLQRGQVLRAVVGIVGAAEHARVGTRIAAGGDRRYGQCVQVGRQFRDRYGMRLLTCALAERMARAGMDRHAPLQIRQAEIYPAIPPECRAEQGEQGLILVDRQQLPVAQRPTPRRKYETHQANFGQKRLCHDQSPSRWLMVLRFMGR